ncbi:hypothetical protein DYB25_007181 [Aphanomyces astaci]|uniref:Carbonic anhydrase n=2 Tax=Aphanomyces astaci TaxID=112090 RepID=A0A397A4W7_APHAT|nr:hypothetical protein DYB36_011531 [Aphanomyces astaci]RHY21607.1 hypothetical protein DYB25_007181 [Aphanomyces astaci]RHY49687.1 hypothetical protein DYB30_008901 [Aphanomyces astaci]RHY68294.1 hypothetical protein DYB34_007780 [Aphanomyces astaci]RHZ33068.1 hypothetical protein DYB31_009883 [Aphanomyces astaci]
MKFFVYAIAATVAIVTGQTLKGQSPIDLPASAKPVANSGNFSVVFNTASAVVSHEDHTVKATWSAGPHSHLTLNGKVYQSLQLHPHAPSEHTLGGKQYPFEVHFVHADKDKNLAVVGIFFDLDPQDKPNPFLTQFFSQFDQLTKPGDNFTLAALDPSSLRVSKSNVFRYSGSLTTEPFTEGVEWNVLQEVQTLSKAQLKQWSNVIHHPNSREIQALNGRVVTLLTKAHSAC